MKTENTNRHADEVQDSEHLPRRVQRTRKADFVMPENTVYVGRPTTWGNPFTIGGMKKPNDEFCQDVVDSREEAIHLFRAYAKGMLIARPKWLDPLKGKNLACWCPLDKPCHADILLNLANGGGGKCNITDAGRLPNE